jgi:glycosyltransferase involved in cell wall biosynthesis
MPRTLRVSLRMIEKDGIRVNVEAAESAPQRRGHFRVARRASLTPVPYGQACQRSWFGYCGPGMESDALEMGAYGLPVLCPASEASAEYVEEDATGFIHGPSDSRTLAELLRRLIADETLRLRLGARGRERAQEQSWDRTAGLVLATIENLAKPVSPPPIARGVCLAEK